MKRVMLVDDEQVSSEITGILSRRNNLPLEVVGEARNGKDAVARSRICCQTWYSWTPMED